MVMSDTDDPTQLTPGDRLRRRREESGISAKQLARRVGRSEGAVRHHENGTSGIPASLLRHYAKALDTTVAWLLTGEEVESKPPKLVELPLLQPIRAGMWLEMDDSVQDEPKIRQATVDYRFPHAHQYLREVKGDSMNLRGVHDGDLALIVSTKETGISVKSGQIAEVTRFRAGGAIREITLKEFQLTDDGPMLLPRSSNPAHSEPLRLSQDQDDGIEAHITGLLLASIRIFE